MPRLVYDAKRLEPALLSQMESFGASGRRLPYVLHAAPEYSSASIYNDSANYARSHAIALRTVGRTVVYQADAQNFYGGESLACTRAG
jgi:hypothetical protein